MDSLEPISIREEERTMIQINIDINKKDLWKTRFEPKTLRKVRDNITIQKRMNATCIFYRVRFEPKTLRKVSRIRISKTKREETIAIQKRMKATCMFCMEGYRLVTLQCRSLEKQGVIVRRV